MVRRVLIGITCCIFPGIVWAGLAASLWELQDGTPLMRAAQAGDVVKVQVLLDRGQDVNERSKQGEATALIFAASEGRVDVVRLLLKRGADPNLCAWANVCPIWWATRIGSYETVKLLVEAGADVKKQPLGDALEHPTLIIAAASGSLNIVKLLLDHGIQVDYTNFFSEQTALASAVAYGRADVAQLLMEHGADLGEVTVVPYSGKLTALEYARQKGHRATVEIVEAALKSGKYNRPTFSIESLIEELYRNPTFDLAAQGNQLQKLLAKQSADTLRKIRNTIFARKNYQFDDPALTDYFRKKFPSYTPTTTKYEMSDIDKRNVQYMKEIEEYRAVRDAAG